MGHGKADKSDRTGRGGNHPCHGTGAKENQNTKIFDIYPHGMSVFLTQKYGIEWLGKQESENNERATQKGQQLNLPPSETRKGTQLPENEPFDLLLICKSGEHGSD